MRSILPSCLAGSALIAASLLVAPRLSLAQGKAPAPAGKAAPGKAAPGKAAPGKAAPPPKPLSSTLTGDAKAQYEAGKILYQDGDFANALVKFQVAYESSRDARLLWNVAACEKNLRRYTLVLAAVERYRREGGDLLSAQDRQDADELEKTIRSLVSSLEVTVNEPGAEIFLDDEKLGTSPLPGPVLIDVGARKLRVTKPGFTSQVLPQQVGGGSVLKLEVKLEKEVHQGKLIVEASPGDAIALDGKLVGTGKWEGVVASGGHTLKVTAPGKSAYQSEVVIQDDKTRRVPITLEAAKGSFPLGIFLAGTGGALAVAGGVVAAILLTRPSQPEPTPGTISPGVLPVNMAGGFRFGGWK
jgi:hypothetical protein